MRVIKKKFVIGFLFSLLAVITNTLFKYHSDYLNLIIENKESIGLKFIVFFLVGYVVLGNLLTFKK